VDPAHELVDVVDEHDAVVATVTREEMRERGLRHRAVYVAVRTSAHELVVHRRADWKDVYPGAWDVCFGGVLGAGEGWDEAARRELAEEAGIDASPRLVAVDAWERAGAALNARVYVVESDGPFTCPDGEVVEVALVPIADLDRWVEGRQICPDSVDLVLPRVRPPAPGDPGGG
jgi:8-oxo-dGTP pyrophosphatase MutT (NUDIX family)